MKNRKATYVGTLPAGSVIAKTLFGFVATHPDHPPKLITATGIVDIVPDLANP